MAQIIVSCKPVPKVILSNRPSEFDRMLLDCVGSDLVKNIDCHDCGFGNIDEWPVALKRAVTRPGIDRIVCRMVTTRVNQDGMNTMYWAYGKDQVDYICNDLKLYNYQNVWNTNGICSLDDYIMMCCRYKWINEMCTVRWLMRDKVSKPLLQYIKNVCKSELEIAGRSATWLQLNCTLLS